MSSPKRKIRGFRDKLHVYGTKAGSQYVRPSDVIMSEEAKEDIRLIREVFGKSQNGASKDPSKKSDEPKADE